MKILDTDVLMINSEGVIQKNFSNYAEAARLLGVSGRGLISRVCNAQYGSCYGHYWLKGSAYKKMQSKQTFSDWLSNNVQISPCIDRLSVPVVKLDKNNYRFLERYPSLKDAAIKNGFNNKNGYDSVLKCCKFNRRTARGYIWILEKDYDSMTIDEIKKLHSEINNVNPNYKKINKYTMPVVKLNKDTYELIDRYNSIMEALSENSSNNKSQLDSILRCCRFTRKSAGGYTWLLEEDFNSLSIDEIRDKFNNTITKKNPSGRKTFDSTPIVQLEPKTFQYIKVFPSITAAATELDLNGSGLSKCCRFQRRTSGGYSWMYLDDFKKFSLEEIKSLYNQIFWS